MHLYFQKDLIDLAQLQHVRFGPFVEDQSGRENEDSLGSEITNLMHESKIRNEIAETHFNKLSISECEMTIELDCFSLQLSPSIDLHQLTSIQNAEDYHFSIPPNHSQSLLNSGYFLRRLQGLNDEILSKLVKIEVRQMGDNIEFDFIKHALLYEEAYTLSLYQPMIYFLVVNVFALIVGFAVLCSNSYAERRDKILQRHKENQDRIIRDATLNTMEDDMTIEEEIHKIDGLVLSLDASDDEGIEVRLADP